MGMTVVSVEPATGRQAASRVESVAYRVEVGEDVDWDAGLAAFAAAETCEVVRTAPKKASKRVDVRRFCTALAHEPGALEMELAVDRRRHGPARGTDTSGRSPGGRDPDNRTARPHGDSPARACRSRHVTLISDVTKTILISVDLSELRVAVVEEGRTVEALHRAPRRRVAGGQHLQGEGRQRPARDGGGVRRPRPPAQRLPARERRGRPRPDVVAHAPAAQDRRAPEARPGDAGPGRQGLDGDEGRRG